MVELVFDWVGNIVRKGENAGKPAFSPFPTMFSKAYGYVRVVNIRDRVVQTELLISDPLFITTLYKGV